MSLSASSKNETHPCPNPETGGAYAARGPDTPDGSLSRGPRSPHPTPPRPKVLVPVKRPCQAVLRKETKALNQPESASPLLSVPLARMSPAREVPVLTAFTTEPCQHDMPARQEVPTLPQLRGPPSGHPLPHPPPARAAQPHRAELWLRRTPPGRGLQGALAAACRRRPLSPGKPYFHLLTPPAADTAPQHGFGVLVCAR